MPPRANTDHDATSLAEQAIDAVNDVEGRHPGYRAFHARGRLYKGRFSATPEAAGLTRAAHMQGDAIDVTVRLSNGSGDPDQPDSAPDARGMAAKFYLPDGSATDIVAVTLPSFVTRSPEDFVELMRARKPARLTGRPRLRAIVPFLATHREALPAVLAALRQKPIPSYANCRYNGIHAFRWIDRSGRSRYVRYSWLPEAGEATLPAREAKARGPDYLREEIVERMNREPVRFRLVLQLAAQGDRVDDPTARWPKERETVVAGILELTGIENERETGGDVLVFDPTRVTDGIELSDDPILHFRSHAYSASVERRSGVARPAHLDA